MSISMSWSSTPLPLAIPTARGMGQAGAGSSARGVASPFDGAVLVAELAGEVLPL